MALDTLEDWKVCRIIMILCFTYGKKKKLKTIVALLLLVLKEQENFANMIEGMVGKIYFISVALLLEYHYLLFFLL